MGLVVNGSGDEVVDRLRQNSQQHERYLHVTGGKLALQNFFWTLITWAWEDGQAVMETYDLNGKHQQQDAPAQLRRQVRVYH